jgi:hypothetical protein
MTVLVGVILLLVFLGFAALMFLERLSALLALPLMAVAFLLVATVADLAQPATVTELVTSETIDAAGGKHLSVTTQPTSARFALYQRARRQQAELLRDKAALLADAVAQVRAELQRGDSELAARLSAAVARIHAADQEFARRAQAALDALPAFFARPPLHAGLRGQYEDELRTVAVSETFRPILPLAGAEHLTADARAKIDALLARAAADSQKATHRYGTPPEPHGRGFVLWGGLSYLLNYLIFVLRAGSLSLAAPIIATIFGGMFAMYVKNLNVAERLIYWTAEYAGQQPFVISLAVFLVTAAIFTSVGGLGTVIMLGTIVLPVLRSVGMARSSAPASSCSASPWAARCSPSRGGYGWTSMAFPRPSSTRSCGSRSRCISSAASHGCGGARARRCGAASTPSPRPPPRAPPRPPSTPTCPPA